MRSSGKFYGKIVMGILFFTLITNNLQGQTELDERAVISFEKGLGFFDPDSLFGVNLRFRMQNRIGMNTISGSNLAPQDFEANVRRLRLRFDGFLGRNNFTYYLQLSFSRGDQDWDNTGFPGIVRDALVFYTFSPHFYMGFGQGKLPGNRQRVVSSGSLQFSDRSSVNAIFNIDRDFGVMAYYSSSIAGVHYNLKTAISSGEGRNITKTDDGLAYTGRIEILPLGLFTDDGDFLEGDLFREPSPKLAVGAGASFNHKARRTSGQRGTFTPESQNIESYFADIIAKYNGWSFFTEFGSRVIRNQDVFNIEEDLYYSFTGWGINSQLSYYFPAGYELAGRFTLIQPHNKIQLLEPERDIYTVGISRYFKSHRNKIQFNISYNDYRRAISTIAPTNFWNVMVQFETGI